VVERIVAELAESGELERLVTAALATSVPAACRSFQLAAVRRNHSTKTINPKVEADPANRHTRSSSFGEST
jgi:hypothetical protein